MGYSIGLDYGTLSVRAVLVNTETGAECASAVFDYPHGVMSETLPSGKALGRDWALQDPQDYLDGLAAVVGGVLRKSGVKADEIIGVGVDFTACTLLTVTEDGTPLCFLPEFADEPHAYAKLWKHHAAQPQADRINALAQAEHADWLERCGGKMSSEFAFPKILQTLDECPAVFDRAARFIEAGDWIVWMMTGRETHNSCMAGYKAAWSKAGYPDNAFWAKLNPKLGDLIGTKVSCAVIPSGTKAGEVHEAGAARTGLAVGTPVASPLIDGHAGMPALCVTEPGPMVLIVGTSSCHFLLSRELCRVPGICGTVEDGILPGYYAYEAGQCCCGDHFDWFVHRCVPEAYMQEAAQRGISIHRLLREKAETLRPGESGLLALDWWNGNRSVLTDADLSGVMLGMTLRTKPEEMYRALIEATAFGTRVIIDRFTECGVAVNGIVAGGGIAEKDPMMMQIYADVTGREIRISASSQTGALGSAIFGAAASGQLTVREASERIGRLKDIVYRPIPENQAIYAELYAEYRRLHDYFGCGENGVLYKLKALRTRKI